MTVCIKNNYKILYYKLKQMLMKKLLLFTTIALMTAGAVSAQTNQVLPDEAFCGVSPNGKYAVSFVFEKLSIHDLSTGDVYTYEEEYTSGNGNTLSNTGIVVGSNMAPNACYWKNGEWKNIESVQGKRMSKADGITPDGSRIVGAVSPESYAGDFEGLMLVPCYWDMQDGTPGDINYLPFPEVDWSGRTPQYITAISISDDGKTIAGQIQDYIGIVCQPIIYHQDADGKWEYTLVQNELYSIEGFELPDYPGEWDGADPSPEAFMTEEEIAAYEAAMEAHVYPTQPEYEDFMSEEEKAAYNAAMEKYYETWDFDDYPYYGDYMTEEEIAAYEAAMEEYYKAENAYWENMPKQEDFMTEEEIAAYEQALKDYNEWQEKYWEYEGALYEIIESLPGMCFNNVILSHDGKTYITSRAQGDFFSGYMYTPYVFNLENNTYQTYSDGLSLNVTTITDNGTILAHKPGSWEDPISEAYILPAGASEFMPLYDYFETANPDLAAWMKENMTHTITVYDYDDDWNMIPVGSYDVLATGIPFANADMSVVVIGIENNWDYETDPYSAYGYVLYTGNAMGIGAVNAQTDGKAEYYTIDGRKVNAPVKGLNIVKTSNGETKKIVVK